MHESGSTNQMQHYVLRPVSNLSQRTTTSYDNITSASSSGPEVECATVLNRVIGSRD